MVTASAEQVLHAGDTVTPARNPIVPYCCTEAVTLLETLTVDRVFTCECDGSVLIALASHPNLLFSAALFRKAL